jgi:hypothetical protein
VEVSLKVRVEMPKKMKVAKKCDKRVVRFTRTQPPITYSYGEEIPRNIRHRIRGDIELTYTPILADDLKTGKTYVLTDSEDEIQLENPGSSRATSQTIGNEQKKEGLELGTMAKRSGSQEDNDPLDILNEDTKTFEGELDEELEYWNEAGGEPLDYEWEEPTEEEPTEVEEDTKPKMICEIKLPITTPETTPKRKEVVRTTREVKIIKHRHVDTPIRGGESKNMFKNRKNRNRSTPKDNNMGNVTFGEHNLKKKNDELSEYETFKHDYEQIYADETGSGFEETTFEK